MLKMQNLLKYSLVLCSMLFFTTVKGQGITHNLSIEILRFNKSIYDSGFHLEGFIWNYVNNYTTNYFPSLNYRLDYKYLSVGAFYQYNSQSYVNSPLGSQEANEGDLLFVNDRHIGVMFGVNHRVGKWTMSSLIMLMKNFNSYISFRGPFVSVIHDTVCYREFNRFRSGLEFQIERTLYKGVFVSVAYQYIFPIDTDISRRCPSTIIHDRFQSQSFSLELGYKF